MPRSRGKLGSRVATGKISGEGKRESVKISWKNNFDQRTDTKGIISRGKSVSQSAAV